MTIVIIMNALKTETMIVIGIALNAYPKALLAQIIIALHLAIMTKLTLVTGMRKTKRATTHHHQPQLIVKPIKTCMPVRKTWLTIVSGTAAPAAPKKKNAQSTNVTIHARPTDAGGTRFPVFAELRNLQNQKLASNMTSMLAIMTL